MSRSNVRYGLLTTIQTTTSLASLCLTCYGLGYSMGTPAMWKDVIVGSCITVSILCNSLRQSLDKSFLESNLLTHNPQELSSNSPNPSAFTTHDPTMPVVINTRTSNEFHDVLL